MFLINPNESALCSRQHELKLTLVVKHVIVRYLKVSVHLTQLWLKQRATCYLIYGQRASLLHTVSLTYYMCVIT